MSSNFYISWGTVFPSGYYYIGDQADWKDAIVPERPAPFWVWNPNPERPTFLDWQFDGHDGDNSYWTPPVTTTTPVTPVTPTVAE